MKKLALLSILLASSAFAQTQPQQPLPHRTTGLDPQGHLEAGLHPTGDPCPHQYEYFITEYYYDYTVNPPKLVYEKTFLFCWGNSGK